MKNKLTELQQQFIDNYCMDTDIDKNYRVSASHWDEYTLMMKDLKKLGYTFDASMVSKDSGSKFQFWFEKR